ncbi:MAG: hypothetical protein NTW87_08320, partial [Planctomycetota bacterium]|nr:hypothetical protein [Planctomycetota bacterium]
MGALVGLSFPVTAAEDPTAPALPKETEAPPPAQGPERPKIRRWLDEPGEQPKSESPAAEKGGPTLPESEAAEREQRLAQQLRVKSLLDQAKKAFKEGDHQRAIDLSRSILYVEPRNIVAAEMLRKAQGKMLDADEVVTDIAAERRDREAILESDEHAVRPPPRLKEVRPHWPRRSEEIEGLRVQKMADKLDQRVTVDFMNADLEWVLNTLFILTGVNIIADQAALQDKTLTLHVEEVPLKEVLNFIVRNNQGIQFSVTEDAVWVTASEGEDLKKLMYPRIYPIHYGLVSTTEGSGGGSGQRSSGTGRAGGGG